MLVSRSIGFNEAITQQVTTQRAIPTDGASGRSTGLLHARDAEQSELRFMTHSSVRFV
jgi:hypothetical protein